MKSRIEKLYVALKQSRLDAVALNPGPTLTYLSGLNFHLLERPVVMFFVPGQDPALALPELEMPKLQELAYRVNAFPYGENPSTWDAAFRNAAQALGLDISGIRIGVEPRALRLLEFRYIQAGARAADFPDANEALGSLRLHKERAEVQKMRRAVEIAEGALKATIPLIRIGVTERELAAELTIQLLRQGSAPELPFAPIVSSGPNSANPHAAPSDRKLQAGDLLVVDWGATFEGYISDLTRTFAMEAVDEEMTQIHRIVQQANAAGRAAARPGATAGEVDKAARDVIEQAGYGAYFTHRTGHGIGLEAHEPPYIRGDNPQILEPGMAFTVEPGIYLPGRGGVRIEDDVVITETGAVCLSEVERELRKF
ncbi:MAG: aminopeptidase P family protein [Anaerolineales bacterium]